MIATNSAHDPTVSLVNQPSIGGVTQTVANAIRAAATKTGVDFAYLLQKAGQESNFDPQAQSHSSSASGLFQFTKQTWLSMVKEYGEKYGLSNLASHINVDSQGTAHADSPTWQHTILNLRQSPELSADMAAELDKQNLTKLKNNVGGPIGATELYLAHFLGATGASTFLQAMKKNPSTDASHIVPLAAQANTNVFYSSNGQHKSLKEVYQMFASKFNNSAQQIVTNTPTINPSLDPAPSKYGATYNVAYNPPPLTLHDETRMTQSQSSQAEAASVKSLGINDKTSLSSLYSNMVIAQMNSSALSAVSQYTSLNHRNHTEKNPMGSLSSLV